jgi:hypothetical protein
MKKLKVKRSIALTTLVLVIVVSACVSNNAVESPTSTLRAVTVTPLATKTRRPSSTPTLVVPTLGPTETYFSILNLLNSNADCEKPCFWGIVPGETTYSEAVTVLHPFGGSHNLVGYRQREYGLYTSIDDPDFKTSISVKITHDFAELVESIFVRMHNPGYEKLSTEPWGFFRPVNILKEYGRPSEIRFGFSHGQEAYVTSVTDRAFNRYLFCPNKPTELEGFTFQLGGELPRIEWHDYEVDKVSDLTASSLYELVLADPEACLYLSPPLWNQ